MIRERWKTYRLRGLRRKMEAQSLEMAELIERGAPFRESAAAIWRGIILEEAIGRIDPSLGLTEEQARQKRIELYERFPEWSPSFADTFSAERSAWSWTLLFSGAWTVVIGASVYGMVAEGPTSSGAIAFVAGTLLVSHRVFEHLAARGRGWARLPMVQARIGMFAFLALLLASGTVELVS